MPKPAGSRGTKSVLTALAAATTLVFVINLAVMAEATTKQPATRSQDPVALAGQQNISNGLCRVLGLVLPNLCPPPPDPAPPTTTTTAATNPPASTSTTAPTTTTAPRATTTSTTVHPAPSPDPEPRWSAHAGTTVGSVNYPVPTDALVVSPAGHDANPGTAQEPFRTLSHAVDHARSGDTIVLRAGSYHESIDMPFNRQMTIQNWPGEAVWLDGSVTVTDWARDGDAWRHDGWTVRFSSDPTFTRGAPDNTADNWRFINENYPMAAHPDQMWIDGVAQRQVGSRAEVVPGSFYLDENNDRLYLGSDPSGATVRASALGRALRIRADGNVIRGIGFRHYAPSMPDLGAVQIDRAPNVTIEHVAIVDSATRGLSIHGENATIRNVHVARSGNLGIGASQANNLELDRVISEDNNTERFNPAPVAGGMKITRSRGLTVRDSVFRDNLATGFWTDQTVVDMTITGNEISGNAHHGAFLELSSLALFANNIVAGNQRWGLKINNTDHTEVWNNTFVNNGGSVWLVQDPRTPASQPSSWQPFGDLDVTWRIGPATFVNNVYSGDTDQFGVMVSVQDSTRERSAEQIGVTTDSNVYNHRDGASPARLLRWTQGASDDYYGDLTAFRSGTGQEATGHQIDGAAVTSSNGEHTGLMPSAQDARPLPAAVATATGLDPGSRYFGARSR